MGKTDNTNLILIGMPGSGKSTVGVIAAKAMGRSFIDTDLVIQENSSNLLQNIIDSDGIEKFLRFEEEAILSLNCSNCIIATGGSAVYSEKAMMYLKKNGIIVFLDTDTDILCRRLDNIKTRGVAMSRGQTIGDLKEIRDPLYKKYADITLTVKDDTVEAIVETLIKNLP